MANLERIVQAVQELPWATRDDQMDACEDVQIYGTASAQIVFVDGDLRFERISPHPLRRRVESIH